MNTSSSLASQIVDRKLARTAIGRIKSSLKKFSCVADINAFRQAFHDAYHAQGQQSGETDLLTAMLGVKKLNDIPALALVVDEGLPFGQVVERRKAMAASLSEFIKHHAPKAHFRVPDNLLTQCLHLIELVQPLAIAEDKYAANYHEMAQAKDEGRLVEEFHHVFVHLVGCENPEQKYVYRAIALHFLAKENSLTTSVRSSPAWELLILEVGTIATRWINTGEPIKTWRGIMALSGMHQLGEIYAGHQLAQSLFFKADAPRIDKQLALEVIELTFEQYRQRRVQGPVFAHGDSETDLYRNYNTIVGEAIRNSDDLVEVDRLTRNLVSVLLEAAEKCMATFDACVLCILTPDFLPLHGVDPENERLHALRHKISAFPDTESWCRELAATPQIKSLQARFY
ncbi:hypothetical protein D9H52_02815 [Escherichia coli]|uniref:hypothetical protein n=1 Tax=Escherichia coli TaxID=562 RepID=UPI000BE518DB|nr:hypothetical protein [Escherichia coli]EEZ8304096.1 hypothetical protein [Escherichia coli]EHT8030380.1 hypothetical protein [Escherichia coli]EJA4572425.1 hypothetical protein [Escherichia coli]MBH9603676.1 hypothetical protein [Escherichia coli]MGS67523.1 hypothetical protein [Escherichia coli]